MFLVESTLISALVTALKNPYLDWHVEISFPPAAAKII